MSYMKATTILSTTVSLLCLISCRGESDLALTPSNVATLSLRDLVSGVSTESAVGTARVGQVPPAGAGPRVAVSGNPTIINGGTLPAEVRSVAPFQTLYVTVGSKTVGLLSESAGGVDGYYEVRLPSPQTDAQVLLAFAQSIPAAELDLLFAVADTVGRVGPFERFPARVASVGTGDVQVTLSWNTDSDVDLHVVDPSGEEVYWGNRRAASGGELDLDSNAACAIDRGRNENITWPVGRAPRGRYTVRVDYWDSCGVGRTDYNVRVNSGGSVQIFSGTFTGSGDQGSAGSGRLITVFERTAGPTVTVIPTPPGRAGNEPRKARPAAGPPSGRVSGK